MKKCCLVLFIYFQVICSLRPENVFLPSKDTVYQSSYPYITGSTVRLHCDHQIDVHNDVNPLQVKSGDSIFIMINFLDHFFSEIHPKIQVPYIIVSSHFFGESDDSLPGKFAPYLDDDKLAAWFTLNADIIHPKIFPMPIGIACAFYNYGNTKIFDECISKFGANTNKSKLLYLNFSLHSKNSRCAEERKEALNLFKDKDWCTNAITTHLQDAVYRKPMNVYLEEMAKHQFVLSPRGNGLDCFRTWEALLMGCYPIVLSSTIDSLFDDLPVVIVKKWDDISKEFLELKKEEFSKKKFNMNKLYMPYWRDEIRKIQKKLREVGSI